jgi:hypothetical protein
MKYDMPAVEKKKSLTVPLVLHKPNVARGYIRVSVNQMKNKRLTVCVCLLSFRGDHQDSDRGLRSASEPLQLQTAV